LQATLSLFEEYQHLSSSENKGWEHIYSSLGSKYEFGTHLLRMLYVLQCEAQHIMARYILELDNASASSRKAEAPPRAALHLIQALADAFLLSFIGLRITQPAKLYLSSMAAAMGILQTVHNNSSPMLAVARVLAKNDVEGAYKDVHIVEYSK